MCWQLIPEGRYQPFHQITYVSPAAALECWHGTRRSGSQASVEPNNAQQDQAQSAPPWLPVIQTVIEALEPFEEACIAVSQAIQDKHPEQFQ